MENIATSILGSIIASVLFAAAYRRYKNKKRALYVDIKQIRVGSLLVWDFTFYNFNFAIDQILLRFPCKKLIVFELSHIKKPIIDQQTNTIHWSGDLAKNCELRLLAVYKSSSMTIDTTEFDNVIIAKSMVRNRITGLQERQKIPIKKNMM